MFLCKKIKMNQRDPLKYFILIVRQTSKTLSVLLHNPRLTEAVNKLRVVLKNRTLDNYYSTDCFCLYVCTLISGPYNIIYKNTKFSLIWFQKKNKIRFFKNVCYKMVFFNTTQLESYIKGTDRVIFI